MVSSTLVDLVAKTVPEAADLFYIVDAALSGLSRSKKITYTDLLASFAVVKDITPQLGANLDVNGKSIVSVSDGNIIIAPDGLGHLELNGQMQINYVATFDVNHALHIVQDAAGFANSTSLQIDYITGALAAGEAASAVRVNIDEVLTTGGTTAGFSVTTTTQGSTDVYGMGVAIGVAPVLQLSGTLGNADSILVKAVDQLTALSTGGAGNISIFVADNDTITIGDAAEFQDLEFIIDTGASGAGIQPVFEFSTGVGTWTAFGPLDGTNAFRTTGNINWLAADIPTWAVGTGDEFLIRITRTQNNLTVTPILDLIQLSAGQFFSWDKLGVLNVKEIDILSGSSFKIDGTAVLGATALGAGVLASSLTSLGTIASLVATTADINAGTVDAVIGATTPAQGTFTDLILTNGQINFPDTQNSSSDANTLDDYEEGTFTPTIAGATVAGSQTYDIQTGTYTKIGNLVTLSVDIRMSALDGATDGIIEIRGLPFASKAGPLRSGLMGFFSSLAGNVVWVSCYNNSGQTRLVMTKITTGSSGSTQMLDSDMTFQTRFVASIMYQTA